MKKKFYAETELLLEEQLKNVVQEDKKINPE